MQTQVNQVWFVLCSDFIDQSLPKDFFTILVLDPQSSCQYLRESSGYPGYLRKTAKDREAQNDYYNAAAKYAMLGEKDAAFADLEKEFALHGVVDLNIDPKFDGIRSDPRFTSLLHRIGLPK